MDPGSVDRLLDVHIKVDDVKDRLQYGGYDPRSASRTNREPRRAVLSQNYRRRHRRQRPFTSLYLVPLALHQPEKVVATRAGGEIVHFIIQKHASTFGSDA